MCFYYLNITKVFLLGKRSATSGGVKILFLWLSLERERERERESERERERESTAKVWRGKRGVHQITSENGRESCP